MDKFNEYQICLERGHTADPYKGATMNAVYGAVPKYTCQYCGTVYWTTTVTNTHESNKPTPPLSGRASYEPSYTT